MKRTFLAKRNRLLSGRGISWGVWALVFAFVVLLLRLIAPNIFWKVVAPAEKVSTALAETTHHFLQSFEDAQTLARENDTLTTRADTLATENKALQVQVTNLQALIGSAPATAPGIVAGVVSHPPQSPYDTLVVAAGTKDNVGIGMEAFAQGGTPLGLVSGVTAHFSRITLFSTAGAMTAGWVGNTALALSLQGGGGGTFSAFVSRDMPVHIGDVVFVPGPGELPIGSVTHIDTDPLSPSVRLRIKPAVNLFSVTEVILRATGSVQMQFATSTAL